MDEEEELKNILIGQPGALGATELIPGFAGVVADIDRRIGAPRQIGRAPGGLPIIGSPGGFRGDPGFAAIIGPDGQPRPAVNPSPMNSMMQQQSLSASSQAPNPVTFRDYDVPEPPRTSVLSSFAPSGDLKPGIDVNAITPSPTTLPVPSDVNTALNREVSVGYPSEKPGFFEPGGFGYQNLGPRLGVNIGEFAGEQLYGTGITAEGQATGLPVDRPSLAGDMLTLPGNLLRGVDFFAGPPVRALPGATKGLIDYTTGATGSQPPQAPPVESALDPETPSINDIAPEITGGLPRGGDSRLTPRPELPSNIDPGFTPGPRPSLPDFIQDRTGREDRVGARTPEISSSVLPDILNPRSDRGREGLSQADARDLAQGLDPNASESQRMRALQIQSRLGLGQFKPERELSELEQREIESRIRGREADIAQGETKAGFQPRLIDVGGESAMELSPGYFQRIPKDTPNKTGLEKTLENLQADLESGRLTQEEYEIASKNARNVYIGRKEPKEPTPSPTPSSEFENIINTVDATDAPQVATGRGQARRGRPVEGADASDIKSFATEAEARASGEKGEVLIAGRRAVIE